MSSSRDPRIDAYIAEARPFARPILEHLRKQVHEAVPAIDEDIKWNAPAYTLGGKLLLITAAFKAHCALSFWAKDMEAVLAADGVDASEGMGQLGKITAIGDLPPPHALHRYLKEAARLAAAGKSTRPAARTAKPPPVTPPDLEAALRLEAHARAAAVWADASPSMRREYIEWITEAKQDATRARRLATTLQWLAEGRGRNWKYENC